MLYACSFQVISHKTKTVLAFRLLTGQSLLITNRIIKVVANYAKFMSKFAAGPLSAIHDHYYHLDNSSRRVHLKMSPHVSNIPKQARNTILHLCARVLLVCWVYWLHLHLRRAHPCGNLRSDCEINRKSRLSLLNYFY